MTFSRSLRLRLAALSVVVLAGSAHATGSGPDLSGITQAGTDLALVGAAVFVVMVGIKAFHWIRRAL